MEGEPSVNGVDGNVTVANERGRDRRVGHGHEFGEVVEHFKAVMKRLDAEERLHKAQLLVFGRNHRGVEDTWRFDLCIRRFGVIGFGLMRRQKGKSRLFLNENERKERNEAHRQADHPKLLRLDSSLFCHLRERGLNFSITWGQLDFFYSQEKKRKKRKKRKEKKSEANRHTKGTERATNVRQNLLQGHQVGLQ